jgi:type VI secretion system protein ImpJ
MSDLDTRLIPPKLKRYQHLDCWDCLGEAVKYLEDRLKQVNVRYTSLVMDEGRDGIFSITFDKAWDEMDLLLELKPRPNQSHEDLERWMADCRIASPKIHKELSMKRLLGASTESIESDDATGITATPGNALFYIKFDPQFIKIGQLLTIACVNGKLKQHQPKRILVHLPHGASLKEQQE